MNLDNSYHEFKDNLNLTSDTNRNRFLVRGALHSYKLVLTEYNYKLNCYSLFSRISLIPFSQMIPYIIQLPLDHLNPTLIDRLRYHLSTCPIRHLSWLFVSRGNQDYTVQMFSPHKCGQESGYSAFNVVIAAFSQIFFCFFPSSLFIRQSSSFELLERSLQLSGHKLEMCQPYPRRISFLKILPCVIYT